MNKIFTHVLLPLVVLAAGGVGTVLLIQGGEQTEAKAPTRELPLVRTQQVPPGAYAIRVEANGVAEATGELTLVPEVGGKVVEVSPALHEGGRVEEGEVLVRIETRAYKIAVAQAKAELRRAEAELELELGRGRTALREWAQFGGAEGEGRLAKRGPQLASAQALVDLRKASVDKAKLDLRRATIRAPYDALVVSEQVEPGQVVTRGAALASLVVADEMWVRAPVRVEALSALELGDDKTEGAGPGTEVRMRLDLGRGEFATLTGEALRLGAEIDADTRKADLIIGVSGRTSSGARLLPGAFLTLELDSPEPTRALRIPRDALVEGRRVWVVDGDQRVSRLNLEIAWTDREAVYVRPSSLDAPWSEGTLEVVLRPPSSMLEGIEVRIEATESEAESEAGSGPESGAAVAESGASSGVDVQAKAQVQGEVDHG